MVKLTQGISSKMVHLKLIFYMNT